MSYSLNALQYSGDFNYGGNQAKYYRDINKTQYVFGM